MRPALRPLTRCAWVLAAIAALAAPGCAKKLPSGPIGAYLVDYPEGRRDSLERTPSDLVVWPDVPLSILETSTDSTIIPTRTFIVYRSAPGVMHGLIADYVQSNGYQMFRSEDGGGFREFNDFSLTAARRWSDRSYYGTLAGEIVMPPAQFFSFADVSPALIPVKGYVGRAVLSGLSGANYPLTNLGSTPDTAAIPSIRYTGRTGQPGTPEAPPDSLLALSWEPVAGAVSYWVHIYQKRADIQSSDDAIAIAHPAPIATGKARDLFIGIFPAPIIAYKLGDPVPPGGRVLVYRVLRGLVEVFVRISAVDASGRMIAAISSDGDLDAVQERFGQVDRRRIFYLGAKKVTPDRPEPDF